MSEILLENGGKPLHVYPSGTDHGENLVAFCFHRGLVFGLDDEAEERLGVGCADVEPPVGILHADAVELEHASVGVFGADFVEDGLDVGDFGDRKSVV